MAKLVCAVCGAERAVPTTGGIVPGQVLSGALHGETVPGPDLKLLYCRCGDPDHEVPMPKHCSKYMKYVA